MDFLSTLQSYGVVNAAVVILIIGIISKMRSAFLDSLLEKLQDGKKLSKGVQKWIILTFLSLLFSFIFSLLIVIGKFDTTLWIWDWVKASLLNWFASWIAHDMIKNLFFKES